MEKNTPSGARELLNRFNSLDPKLDLPQEETRKILWIPMATLVVLGVFYICFQAWWVPVLIVLGIGLWNVVALLSFKKPKLILPPKCSMDTLEMAFHFTAKSNRVLFLAIPFLALLFLAPIFEPSLAAWSVTLILLLPLRRLMRFDKGFCRRYADRDHAALFLASLAGIAAFFWSLSRIEPIPPVGSILGGQEAVESETSGKSESPAESERKGGVEETKRDGSVPAEALSRIAALEEFQSALRERLAAWERGEDPALPNLGKLEKSVRDVSSEHSRLQERIAALERSGSTVRDLEANIARIRGRLEDMENSGISGHGDSEMERLASWEQAKKTWDQEKSTLQTAFDALKQEKKSLSVKIVEQDAQLSSLQGSLDLRSKESASLSARIEQLQRDNQSLQLIAKSQEGLQARIQSLEAENASLKLQSGGSESAQARVRQLEAENESLKLMEKAQKTTWARILQVEEENRKLLQEKQKLDKDLQTLPIKIAENANLRQEKQSMEQELLSLRAKAVEIENLRRDKQRLEEDVRALRSGGDELAALRAAKQRLEQDVQILRAGAIEVESLRAEKQRLESQEQTLRAEKQSMEEELRTLRARVQELESAAAQKGEGN